MRLAALLIMIMMLIPSTISAQTPVPMTGLKVIAERQYAASTDQPLETAGDGVLLLTVRVYQFENEEQANPVFETLVEAEGVTSQLPKDGSVTLETTDLKDVGHRGVILNLEAGSQNDRLGYFRTAIVQNESLIVNVTVIAGSPESSEKAEAIAAAMLEREVGSGETVYEGTGKSTGGVWDLFLEPEDSLLEGLTAYQDKEIRPRD